VWTGNLSILSMKSPLRACSICFRTAPSPRCCTRIRSDCLNNSPSNVFLIYPQIFSFKCAGLTIMEKWHNQSTAQRESGWATGAMMSGSFPLFYQEVTRPRERCTTNIALTDRKTADILVLIVYAQSSAVSHVAELMERQGKRNAFRHLACIERLIVILRSDAVYQIVHSRKRFLLVKK